MAENSKIEIKIDRRSKQEFKKLASKFGLTMSGAIKTFVKHVNLHSEFPFKIKTKTRRLTSQEEQALTPEEMGEYIESLAD